MLSVWVPPADATTILPFISTPTGDLIVSQSRAAPVAA